MQRDFENPPTLAVAKESNSIVLMERNSALSMVKPGFTRYQFLIKRVMDLVIAAVCIITLLPAIILIAVLVKTSSNGPVLFKQTRIGFLGRPFACYKFRSMYHELQDATCEQQVVQRDFRVTPLGRWLRGLSLDELPQFYNVIRGEMSLVGPRPHAPATKAGNIPFHVALENYSYRHGVLPGITGLAQVNGCRGRTETVEDIRRRVEFDLRYIQQWSIVLDVRILASTLFNMVDVQEIA